MGFFLSQTNHQTRCWTLQDRFDYHRVKKRKNIWKPEPTRPKQLRYLSLLLLANSGILGLSELGGTRVSTTGIGTDVWVKITFQWFNIAIQSWYIHGHISSIEPSHFPSLSEVVRGHPLVHPGTAQWIFICPLRLHIDVVKPSICCVWRKGNRSKQNYAFRTHAATVYIFKHHSNTLVKC